MDGRGGVALALLALLVLVAGGEARRGLASISAAENAYWSAHGLGIVQSGAQAGKVVTWFSGDKAMQVYVTSPPGAGGAAPKAAVVVFTDIYGFALNNTRLWADRLAKATGLLVVVPDYFRGDPVTEATRPQMPQWRLRHPKERVLADWAAVLAQVKKTWPSVKRVGVQGFCWGGLYAVLLSGAASPRADAAVGFHASGITPEAIDAVSGPLSLQQSDPLLDSGFNATLVAYVKKAFAAKSAKGPPATIRTYPGMPHGFALRGNLSDPAWAKSSASAFDEGARFLAAQLLGAPAAAPKDASVAAKP